jgi:hypothetical protein
MWTLKQFGLQFMNPFVDTWNEPFDLFQDLQRTNEQQIDQYGNMTMNTRDVVATNQALLPNFFGSSDGSGGLKALIGNVRIFMPPPTLIYNPLSTIISSVLSGIGHEQRHIKTSAFGFQGGQQWTPNYREQIASELFTRNTLTGEESILSSVSQTGPLGFSAGTGPQNLGTQTIRRFPSDLNQHYEAQTTYRNRTGFSTQNIGGVDYREKSFHRKQNGDWLIPTDETVDWWTLGGANGMGGATQGGFGNVEATDYFESPQKADPITHQRRYNRLIGLMKEMLQQSFSPM